jgi:hypothetical protein
MNTLNLNEAIRTLGSMPSNVCLLIDPNFDIRTLERQVEQSDFKFFYIDGHGLINKGDFLNRAKASLQFPDYFGYNWDAFEDCLKSISLNREKDKGDVILYTDYMEFSQNDSENFAVLLDIFYAVVKFRNNYAHNLPLYIWLVK